MGLTLVWASPFGERGGGFTILVCVRTPIVRQPIGTGFIITLIWVIVECGVGGVPGEPGSHDNR